MTGPSLAIAAGIFLGLTFLAWRRYLWVARKARAEREESCPYSLTDVFASRLSASVRHQQGAQWLPEIFSRSARRFPDLVALQVPHTGESLSFAELDARASRVAAAVSPWLNGPDQVVAVAMPQDNAQIVAAHLGILKAGGTVLFLDTTLPEALVAHMLADAAPVAVLTRGQASFRGLPTIDLLNLAEAQPENRSPPLPSPAWLDDPRQRLATLFYTSGTTGMPKGVECPHAGYVNLALTYADSLALVPGLDATSLTSSLGYDGSISEMYSAWVSGCTVVLLTKEEVRSGPDLLPVLRAAEVTVLFCPPALLPTLSTTPEVDLPHPICRFIVPAGEAFPPALVEPWTRGRRQILNTYGPTEASTDTSRQSLRPGEPVTIGSPFPNVTYVLLAEGELRPLAHGETGELCIGGVHLARGYRNLPLETERKFILHPTFGRLYRTGDRCRIDPQTHRVQFLGRIDAQLKVRGHRVEVQPVEDILQTQIEEIEAAVLDYQNQELVAFVTAPALRDASSPPVSPAPAAWAERLRANLARQLPEPSVPSRFFLVERFQLNPVSGKIDRRRLPDLSRLAANATEHDGVPGAPAATPRAAIETEAPEGGDEVLAICRAVIAPGLGWDDTFADHGGHSILIAHLAARLRSAGWRVTVRELLDGHDTPRRVAALPRSAGEAAALRPEAPAADLAVGSAAESATSPASAFEVLSTARFTTLQVLFLLLLYTPPVGAVLAAVAAAGVGELVLDARLGEFLLLGLGTYLLALLLPFANLVWVRMIRRILRGGRRPTRLPPGIYPKWSRAHLRVWYGERLALSVLWPLRSLIRSAPLLAWVLRRLGATVGRNLQCAHDVEFFGPLDLLTLEDDVTIQTGAYIATASWVGQQLHVGPVLLGRGSVLGMRAGVANHSSVGRGSWITPLTPILGDVGPEEIWEGAPARCIGRCTELARTTAHARQRLPGWLLETLNLSLQVSLECLLLVLPSTAVAWWSASVIFVDGARNAGFASHPSPSSPPSPPSQYFDLAPPPELLGHIGLYAFVTGWITILLISVIGCLFVRWTATSPGIYPASGLRAALLLYRVKKLNHIQRLWTWTVTGQYLRALAGVRFARVGASECDLMTNLVPEAATVDSRVFWSHGSFTNSLDQRARYLHLREIDMPANFFASNNCVAESGQLPTNFLLGVSTPGSDIRFRRQMRARLGPPITVAGNPPVRFGSADFGAENRAEELPGFALFLGRVALNDLFSIGLLPITEVLAFAVFYTLLTRSFGHPILSALAAPLLVEGFLVGSSALVKKLLVGDRWGIDDSTPFWSWRHFTYFFAQDCFFAWCRRPMGILAGTVLANPILRRMGCRIGKRTLLAGPLQAFDWNAVSLGDDCVLAGLLQLHSFENMRLQVKRTEFRNGTSVNFGALVMGGAILEPGTTLLPLSLVLKQMALPAATYEGSPAEPVGDPRRELSPRADSGLPS